MQKKLIPWMVYNRENTEEFLTQGAAYEAYGADELYISCDAKDYSSREEFLKAAGELAKQVDIPIVISFHLERFEDVKKALYTGAKAMAVNVCDLRGVSGKWEHTEEETSGMKALKEASARFGKERIYLEVKEEEDNKSLITWAEEFVSAIIIDKCERKALSDTVIHGSTADLSAVCNGSKSETQAGNKNLLETQLPFLIKSGSLECQEKKAASGEQEAWLGVKEELSEDRTEGIIADYGKEENINIIKKALKKENIPVNTYESSIPFSQMKKNNDGLLPVVVQDYKTKEVLMVAYMNEEAYNKTVETGRMTYYSRSRSKLWLKGETSGHFQYVKSLTIDCDKDTLLARVRQVGPACHTGNPTCFFEETYKKPYDDTNPLTVLDEVYSVIMDRKEHPKEGSYTNYLFDKGIDKILKKCGEEAAEIIIAAKNPDSSELKYEISDFLYHMMVLMAQCGLDWKDIIKELAHRR
ncbi:bifunctional phosphoribosyl-AMP cyclohydrolase/phosphoribosyl-ATP diphosphatase HisIE [Anaerocolumna jejuensis]|uniref:bifunctional phosphoribosyl-AMP cyclohydrolase/phosphoribosyl-ATP diphosphatase HisIE n=1 Tax=Anaerocolumna jejuensis TaxID=259063 RepID=UPI003F7B99C0